MSTALRQADVLSRTIARTIDVLLATAMMEAIPRVGYYMGIVYVLVGDGFFDGASVGKKLMGLVVRKSDGADTLTVRDSILRNATLGLAVIFWRLPFVGWLLFFVIAGLEFIIMIGSSERMRIGDEIAGTKVLSTRVLQTDKCKEDQ
ncbi:MAG: RDD family protein [Nitrospirae bacterium]|nr:RDD family protein [Nitrospirota bacterium]